VTTDFQRRQRVIFIGLICALIGIVVVPLMRARQALPKAGVVSVPSTGVGSDLPPADGTLPGPTIAKTPASYRDVRSYGAIGDAVADDAAAIQAAINAASAGDTIFIPHGTYRLTGTLTLGAAVNVIGDDRITTVLVWPNSRVIGVTIPGAASRSHIAHLTIRGGNVRATLYAGVNSGNASDVIVEDCIIEQWGGPGINTGGSSTRWIIRNNLVRNNFNQGIFIAGLTTDSLVSGNRVTGNAYNGIDVNGSANLITQNEVLSNGASGGSVDRWGILIAGVATGSASADYNVVSNNTVSANGAQGIIVRAEAGVTANYNLIMGNETDANTGSTGNGDGIAIDGSAPGRLTGNAVIGNIAQRNQRYGLLIDSSIGSVNNSIVMGNTLLGNATPFLDTSVTTLNLGNPTAFAQPNPYLALPPHAPGAVPTLSSLRGTAIDAPTWQSELAAIYYASLVYQYLVLDEHLCGPGGAITDSVGVAPSKAQCPVVLRDHRAP
jgi:parallel beta-helix repeat protein